MANVKFAFLHQRERFIPVQIPTLLERILADARLSPQEREQLAALAELLQARIHFEFLQESQTLKALYDPFNPDRDTLPLHTDESTHRHAQFEKLRDRIEFLLDKSNYTKLTPEQLAACMESKSRWGLAVKIDPRQYEEIDVYYRGVRQESRTECSWRTLWQPIQVPRWVFSRVVVLVRQTDPIRGDRVLLKLFKEIVIDDLKMTWPNLRILMHPVDRLMIALGAAGGIFTTLWKLLVAAALSPYLVATVVFGCISAVARAVWGFLACKDKYVKTLTHNLYYQNLANNLSAAARLIETAEAEEIKETLLAYYLLYTERQQDYTAEELDRRIEQWLTDEFSLSQVDFEIEDALGKLEAKELAVCRPGGGPGGEVESTVSDQPLASRSPSEPIGTDPESIGKDGQIWKVYDLPTALRRLDRWWDERFAYHEPASAEEPERVADATWPPR